MSLRASALILLSLVPSACMAAEVYPGQGEMEKLGQVMAQKLAALNRGAVAIAPMGNQNLERTDLGRLLEPDFLRSFKEARPELPVVGQSLMADILRQHRMEQTALASPQKLGEAGKFLNTPVLVYVVAEPLAGSILVRAVASDTRTAEFLLGEQIVLPRSDVLVARLTAKERRALEPRAVPQARKSSSKILYELLGCRRQGSTVTCTVDLTSQKGDQRIRLRRDGTRANSSQGRPFQVATLNTGKQRGWKLLLKGIPNRVDLDFANIPQDLDSFSMLRLAVEDMDGAKFTDVRIAG